MARDRSDFSVLQQPSNSRQSGWACRLKRLGLGCAGLGLPRDRQSDTQAEDIVERAFAAGIRCFDVAPLYGGGLAEIRLGRALRHLPRSELTISTKTGVDRPFGQGPIPPGGTRRREADIWDYSRAATLRSIDRSLERLGLDRLDLVHLHDVYDHLEASLEAFHTLCDLKARGLLGGIGVGSNTVDAASAVLDRVPLDAVLIAGRTTLLDNTAEVLLRAAACRQVTVLVGGVFNSGILARWPQADVTFFNDPADAHVRNRVGAIAAICARYGVPMRAAALQFPFRNPAVSIVLIGPTSVQELEQNLDDLRLEIPEDLWRDLASAEMVAPRGHDGEVTE